MPNTRSRSALSHMPAVLLPARPDRFIPLLTILCGALGASYVGLVIMTILFATWQTQEVSTMRSTESAISLLESSYYTEVAKLDAVNPSSLGFVTPHDTRYVSAVTDPNLTFAGN